MNYNTILTIFGLDPSNFKHIISEPFISNGVITMYVEQRTDAGRECPHCKSNNISIKDFDDIIIRCTNNTNQKIELIVKKVRFKCKVCKKTFTPQLKNIDPHTNISNSVKRLIIFDFFERISFSSIARKYDVSPGTVFNLFDNTFPCVERGKMPRILCIDEFHFSKVIDQNYCCIIVDFEKNEIVDIIKNRRKEYLYEYFSNISDEEKNEVKYFISDMYDGYKYIHHKFFPNSIHIIDKFHIILQLTQAISKRRVKLMKEVKSTNPMLYNFMKTNWSLFESNKNKIPNKEYRNKKTGYIYSYEQLLYECLKLDNSLSIAYDELQKLFSKPYYLPKDKLYDFFINVSEMLNNTDDVEIKKVGSTYKKWMNEIVNAYMDEAIKYRLTNSLAENNNNHIKTLIKVSYGLNDFDRMRKRSILISRKRKKSRRQLPST